MVRRGEDLTCAQVKELPRGARVRLMCEKHPSGPLDIPDPAKYSDPQVTLVYYDYFVPGLREVLQPVQVHPRSHPEGAGEAAEGGGPASATIGTKTERVDKQLGVVAAIAADTAAATATVCLHLALHNPFTTPSPST